MEPINVFYQSLSREDAAKLLVTPSALGEITLDDARQIVSYMKPKRIKAGTQFIREGEKDHNDFLMLVLQGDAAVENMVPGRPSDGMVMSVAGPGSLIGEMGLLDDSPRSATCTASTDMAVAVLGREALQRLIQEQPAVGARLMVAISQRISIRLRETTQKLLRFVQLNNVLQNEVLALLKASAGKNQVRPADPPGTAIV